MFPELKILHEYLHCVCAKLNFDPNKLEYGFLCHGDSEDDHMVIINSIENPVNLKKCKNVKSELKWDLFIKFGLRE